MCSCLPVCPRLDSHFVPIAAPAPLDTWLSESVAALELELYDQAGYPNFHSYQHTLCDVLHGFSPNDPTDYADRCARRHLGTTLPPPTHPLPPDMIYLYEVTGEEFNPVTTKDERSLYIRLVMENGAGDWPNFHRSWDAAVDGTLVRYQPHTCPAFVHVASSNVLFRY